MPTPVILQGAHRADRSTWPLHRVDASRRWEAEVAEALPAGSLMVRAGLAIARLSLGVAPHAQRIQVLCGTGNNGGDGLLAAAHLHRLGKQVEVHLLSDQTLPTDARMALDEARGAGVPIVIDGLRFDRISEADLLVDAVFGMGLNRAPNGAAAQWIQAMNAARAPVLAVDLPSGLHADTGRALDPVGTIRARWTLSLLTLKPGLSTAAGRDHCGDLWFDDLGAPAPADRADALLVTATGRLWPHRQHAQHKGSFGDVWVVGGAQGMRGAAWLAARASLAAGAGRVMVVCVDASSSTEFDTLHPELMLRTLEGFRSSSTPLESSTVVCGCGGGLDAMRAVLPLVIARAGRLLLDADALSTLAADSAVRQQLTARQARGRPTIATPHPLEAARCLSIDTTAVQADRCAAAQRLAQHLSSTVVLKGSGSIIATPQGELSINGSGNAALATAGTGDVLAGWIGGLWSQGLGALEAARLGTFTHGVAADHWQRARARPTVLEASELIQILRSLD